MRSAIFFALFLVTSLSIGAQAQDYGQEPIQPSAVTIDIADQPGCPLKLTVDPPQLDPPSSQIRLVNTDPKTIEAYVLVIEGDPGIMQVNSTIMPFRTKGTRSFLFRTTDKFQQGKFTTAIDYVKFADGTTWGDDRFGRSKYIDAFMTGHNLAVSRLKDMLGGDIPDDFQKPIDDSGLYIFLENYKQLPPDELNRRTFIAYREVINRLRQSPKRTEEAQELARKLELMEKDLS